MGQDRSTVVYSSSHLDDMMRYTHKIIGLYLSTLASLKDAAHPSQKFGSDSSACASSINNQTHHNFARFWSEKSYLALWLHAC
jgi:hypothetical protein